MGYDAGTGGLLPFLLENVRSRMLYEGEVQPTRNTDRTMVSPSNCRKDRRVTDVRRLRQDSRLPAASSERAVKDDVPLRRPVG